MGCTMKEIGERIAELRNGQGISQGELAKELYIDRGVVAKWENGSREIKPGHTVDLADFFNVPCDYILRGIQSEQLDIHKATGLDDEAIERLMRRKSKGKIKHIKRLIMLMNYFITSPYSDLILQNIDEHIQNYKRACEILIDNPNVDFKHASIQNVFDMKEYDENMLRLEYRTCKDSMQLALFNVQEDIKDFVYSLTKNDDVIQKLEYKERFFSTCVSVVN